MLHAPKHCAMKIVVKHMEIVVKHWRSFLGENFCPLLEHVKILFGGLEF
jgi:hypothetical protein